MASLTCYLHSHNSSTHALLPDDILCQILYSLSLRHRAIASRVCTTWHHMIASFDDNIFVQSQDSTNRFCTLCPRKSNKNCSYNLHPVVLKCAADNTSTFTELYLMDTNYLSPAIFQSRLLLTVMYLKSCKFEEKIFGDIKELPLLKEIYLVYVQISPTTFSKLINSCPSIAELTLTNCYYERCIFPILLPDLNQLKKVHLNVTGVGPIEIKARNLREFYLFQSSSISVVKLDLRACTKLQILKIDCNYIPIGFPKDISSAFLCLKSLCLHSCKRLKKFKLSSPELENLTLSNMVDLDDAVIVTPNLRSFKLIDIKKVPISCPVVGSSLMEVEIGFKYVPSISRLLRYLRASAGTLGENLTFSLTTDATKWKEESFQSGNLGSNIQPLRVKQIDLLILFSWEPSYEFLIDELFSYFHPRTLLVKVNSDALKYNFIQVLLDELKGWESGKRYKYSNNMCWRYFLKGFKILESTTRRRANQISLEFQWRAH